MNKQIIKDLRIEPLHEAYLEQIATIFNAICEEKRYFLYTRAQPRANCLAFYKSLLATQAIHWVALNGDEVIGWCDIVTISTDARAHTGVLGIGLAPAYRHMGIGRLLMEKALSEAQKKGLTRVELGVFEHNENAQALYKKMGFEIEGRQRKGLLIDGVYQDHILMAKLFV